MARSHALSRPRDTKSLSRKPPQKVPGSITLIVCEGKTEETYFGMVCRHYRLPTATVVVARASTKSAPIRVVQHAKDKNDEDGGYDKVFCVFDRDDHESFDRALGEIKKLASRKRKPIPIVGVISIPCFEVWLLLHFEKTSAPFGRCDDVIKHLNAYIGYKKAHLDSHTPSELMARLEEALNNAAWLEENTASNGRNPFTRIHEVLLHLRSAATECR